MGIRTGAVTHTPPSPPWTRGDTKPPRRPRAPPAGRLPVLLRHAAERRRGLAPEARRAGPPHAARAVPNHRQPGAVPAPGPRPRPRPGGAGGGGLSGAGAEPGGGGSYERHRHGLQAAQHHRRCSTATPPARGRCSAGF